MRQIKLLKLLFESSQTDDEFGHFGSAGAGILIKAKDTNRWLILLRSQEVNEPDTWGLAGGKMEEDESPEVAARREVDEELGSPYSINNLKLVYIYAPEDPEDSFRFYNFIGSVEEEFEPTLDWETDGFKWVTYKELLNQPKKHFGLKAVIKNASESLSKKE